MRNQAQRAKCRGCGRDRGETEAFSARGLCSECSINRAVNLNGSSPISTPEKTMRYRRGVARGVGAIIIEDIADFLASQGMVVTERKQDGD